MFQKKVWTNIVRMNDGSGDACGSNYTDPDTRTKYVKKTAEELYDIVHKVRTDGTTFRVGSTESENVLDRMKDGDYKRIVPGKTIFWAPVHGNAYLREAEDRLLVCCDGHLSNSHTKSNKSDDVKGGCLYAFEMK